MSELDALLAELLSDLDDDEDPVVLLKAIPFISVTNGCCLYSYLSYNG